MKGASGVRTPAAPWGQFYASRPGQCYLSYLTTRGQATGNGPNGPSAHNENEQEKCMGGRGQTRDCTTRYGQTKATNGLLCLVG